MRKNLISLGFSALVLCSIVMTSYAVDMSVPTLTSSQIQTFLDKGYTLSVANPNYSECNDLKIKYNQEYDKFVRSDCFVDNGSYKYFICQKDESCKLDGVTQSSTVKTSVSNNVESSQSSSATPTPNQSKLDAFLDAVKGKQALYNNDTKYEKLLTGLLEKLNTLGVKYKGNATVEPMVTYLVHGVQDLKLEFLKNQDTDNFFCDLGGACDTQATGTASSANNLGNDIVKPPKSTAVVIPVPTGTLELSQNNKPLTPTDGRYSVESAKGNITAKLNIKNAEGCWISPGYVKDGVAYSNQTNGGEFLPPTGTLVIAPFDTKHGKFYDISIKCGSRATGWMNATQVKHFFVNTVEPTIAGNNTNSSTVGVQGAPEEDLIVSVICAQNGWPASIEISGNDSHHTIAKKDGQFLRHVSDFSSSSDNVYRAQLNGDETSIEVHPINSNGTPLATVNVASCVQRNYPAKPEILSAKFDSTTKTLTVQTKNALENDIIDIFDGSSYGSLFWTKDGQVYTAQLKDPYYKGLISLIESGKSNLGIFGSFEPNYWRNGVRNTRYPIDITSTSSN